MKNLLFANTLVVATTAASAYVGAKTKGVVHVQIDANNKAPFIFTGFNGANVVPSTLYVDRATLKFEKTNYAAAANFAWTAADVEHNSNWANTEFAVTIFRKGAVFNERNVWTASGATIEQLVKNINKSTSTHGITASGTTGSETVSFAGSDYDDYAIVIKDTGFDSNNKYKESNIAKSEDATSNITHGTKGFGNEVQLKELIMSCIGADGVTSTFIDAAPNGTKDSDYFTGKYPFEAGKYTIYNIRYSNPRYDHNKDEQLNCMLHLVVRTKDGSDTNVNKDALDDLEDAFAGAYSASSNAEPAAGGGAGGGTQGGSDNAGGGSGTTSGTNNNDNSGTGTNP